MEIKSVFPNDGRIPEKYTCDGENVNPPIELIDVPKNVKSLVLLVDDPDSPSKVWTHWILWNIPPDTKKIKENSVPSGAREGVNDFGEARYGGPCPHSGTHRYRFRIYALDTILNLSSGSAKEELETIITGHVIGKAIITGIYSRK